MKSSPSAPKKRDSDSSNQTVTGTPPPYHFETPPIYQVKKSLSGFTLYLNIDSRNIIAGLFFTGPADSPWLGAFSELCLVSEGRRLSGHFLSSIRPTSPVKQWNLPLWLLRAASREFLQTLAPRNRILGYDADELICRCFGVYLPEILPFSSPREVADETRAGGGCTRCRRHIEAIVGTRHRPHSAVSTQDFEKIQVLTNVFLKHRFPTVELRLVGIRGNRILVVFSGEGHKKDAILQSVEKLIAQNFPFELFLDCS